MLNNTNWLEVILGFTHCQRQVLRFPLPFPNESRENQSLVILSRNGINTLALEQEDSNSPVVEEEYFN